MADVIDFPQPPTGYDEEIIEALRLVPAWFIPRMMTDSWSFGLLTDAGITLCIETINKVRQGADGTIWIDVTMMDSLPFYKTSEMLIVPTSRKTASVQASKIIAAFELADT